MKLSEVLEVSFDDLLGENGEGTPREPARFDVQNRRLKELCREVDRLDPQDQEVVCHVMDSLIRKERMKAILDDRMPRGG